MSETPTSLVPIWPQFVVPVLRAMSSGETLARRTIVSRAIESLDLPEAALDETLGSGGSRAINRTQWAMTHLGKASLIERVARGEWRITDAGRTWLAANPQGFSDFRTADQFFAPFYPPKSTHVTPTTQPVEAAESADPIERIEDGVGLANAAVRDELLARLRGSDPSFFEQAVVDVLLAMGYGGAEQRGKRIGGTGDGGVDGVIDQDALGLDQIYVQAKRYAAGNTVGREAIQAFIGALHGVNASRGVFITSSSFTQHAIEYARQISTRVILINGERLAELMIQYRVGVQVKARYDVVEVDEDFFE
ncbi:restriction endonuclease [Demequina soli]|uniref:restriction endonuclease n=1 Tax=Demequina soli TaxID=1638987 RepID=UPI000780EFAB|nr:restriction endonuclease [Demequina soli]